MWRQYIVMLSFAAIGCSGSGATLPTEGERADMSQDRELIVVAAPRSDDAYYKAVANDIFDFHVTYAEAVRSHDDFLVLTDEASYERYAEALGDEHVAIAPQDDIWARDFSLSNAADPVMFRYTAEGQGGAQDGQNAADEVQEALAGMMERVGIEFRESDLLNDGGNFVDDYAGRAVISRKFLRDNGLNESEGRDLIIDATGLEHVAFIEADEQGGLEHADGVVAFIDPNVLVINSYPEDPDYSADLKADLLAGLPGVVIHEITTPYDGSDIYDDKFGSACGLYTNMLVTPDRIYLPQFGIPEDAIALESVRSWTHKQVIPVRSDTVCYMGGGVRCMSWQVRGENAQRLLDWANL